MDKDRFSQEKEEKQRLAAKETLPEAGDGQEDVGEALPEETLAQAPAYYEEPEEEYSEATVARKWDNKKKRRSVRPLHFLIMIVFALGLVTGGYFAIQALFPPEVPEEEEPMSSEYDYLVQFQAKDLSGMHFAFRDGYSYELKLTQGVNDAGYTVTLFTVVDKTEYVFNTTAFSSLMSAGLSITSSNTAVEAPEDLGIYGLDDPLARVTYIQAESGEETVLLVGNAAPVGTGYYAMLEGDDKVYVIAAYNANYLLQKDMYYRELTLTSYADVMAEVSGVWITGRDGSQLAVEATTPEDMERIGMFATDFQIREPVQTGCNTVYLEEYIYSRLAALTALRVVEDRPEDLSIYGLSEEDDVISIQIDNVDGTSKRLYLGAVNEDGEIYARISGITSVYTFAASDFDFVETKYRDIMDFALWIFMINTIESIEMHLDGEDYLLEYKHLPEDELYATLNGEEISGENGRQLYSRILQIYSYDVLAEDAQIGDVVYSITLHFLDGTSHTLDFAQITSRAFAVIRNGEPTGVYTRIPDIQKIPDAIADVLTGYTLKTSS